QAPHIALRWRAWAPSWLNVGLVGDKTGAGLHDIDFSVAAPGVRDFAGNGAPRPLVVNFAAPVAPQLRIGHEAPDVAISPAITGRWIWSSATQLTFQPNADWPLATRYEVTLGRKALAPHVDVKRRAFEFDSPAFTVRMETPQFYQDPTQPTLRRVVVQVDFSHPVDTASFESRVHLDDGSARKFSVAYDKLKLQASLQSEPLPIPAETVPMKITIDAGVVAAHGGEGKGTHDAIAQSVDVPGLYSLAVSEVSASIVSNDNGDPEHMLRVTATMPVHERAFAQAVHAWLLPVSDKPGGEAFAWSDPSEVTDAVLKRSTAMKLEAVPGEREVDESLALRMPQAEGGRFVYVQVDKGLATPGGYQLGAPRTEILQIKTFAPELTIMSRGSLLALSGEKKLPLLVRDLPGVQVELARVLPQQLHLLVTQANGEFTKPQFFGRLGADALTERFERKIPLQLRPGKTHYETLDFADYLKGPGGERRGVFLLQVRGYDPNAQARPAQPAQAEGGDTGGDSGGDNPDASADSGDGSDNGGGGDGAPQVDPSTMTDGRLVVVTDLGLIAKRAVDGTRDVFVQSIATGAPVAGATIEVWGRNGQVVTTAQTDATGRATLADLSAFVRERQPVLLAARKDGDLSFLPLGGAASLGRGDRTLDMSRFDVGGLHSNGLPNQMTAFLFSDRGIYRPGDTIHVGAVVKAANWAASAKDLPVEVEVTDARGLSVRRQTLVVGASGALEITHATQESSPTGDWTITVSLPRRTSPGAPDAPAQVLGSTTVKVQEFMPDRTKVAAHLTAERAEGWVSPANLGVDVDVQNLFGTPAQHRRVDATMTLSPTWPSFAAYPDYAFFEGRNGQQQTDDLGSQESDTDGKTHFDLRLERFQSATYEAVVLVKAFEPEGGRSVSTEVQALVSDRPYLVGVKTPDSLEYVSRNARREVHVIAIDPKAQRIAVDGLTLVRLEHKTLSVLVKQSNGLYRYESRAKDVTLSQVPFRIGAAGTALALDTSTPGNFGYEVRDATGLVLNRVAYAVAGAANLTRSLDRNAELQIKLDKTDYQPGDTIELSVQAPYTGAGLITIERDKVYAHAWFKADKTASVQHIVVPKDFEGNGYVNVQFVRDPASDEIYTSPLSYGAVPFATGVERRRAHVKLTASEKVKPGETVKMTLTSDKPAKAFVFAVDEGILQVARYQTPDPLAFFFQKRALEVTTLQTLDLVLPEFAKLMHGVAPGGDGASEAARQLNPFKRKRDKPVAFWSGLVDVNGTKEFSYPVPDSFNGQLRVMAVVVDDDHVASASTKAIVRGDLVLLPTVPVSMTPGDQVDVGVGVANNIAGSGKDAPVKLALSVGAGLEVVGDAQQVLRISERGEASAVFHLRAKSGAAASLGSSSVVFTATSGKSSARLSTDTSVRPASALVTLVQSGTAIGGGELKSQLNAYPNFATSELSVSSTPWAFAATLMQYLQEYPYGCTEQITSQVVPAVLLAGQPELARDMAKARAGAGAAPLDTKAAMDRWIAQLRARQSADGGIALWPGNGPDEFATMYAVQVLVEARERKLPVPADLVAKADQFLQARLGSATASGGWAWRTQAEMAWVLTRQGIQVPAALANLRRVAATQKTPTDIGNAYLAASFQAIKQDAAARELFQPVWDDLVARSRAHAPRTAWEWYDDPLSHDATVLYLAAHWFPKSLQQLPASTWETMSKMIGNGWYDSHSTASTLLAVDGYAQAAAASARGQLKASVVDAQGKVQPLPLLGELRTMAKAAVPPAAAAVRLANGGDLPVFYGWAQTGYERNLPETANYHGIEITHVILDDKGKAITEAKIGDEVTVQVTVRSTDRDTVNQVALVDVLPGGLEPVLQPDAAPQAGDQGDGGQGGDQDGGAQPAWRRRLGGTGTWALDYADVREDRVIFFGNIDRSARTITYRARATNTGQFAHPAAYAEAMYERRLYGRSAAGHFAVAPVAKK
ncbi:MAG TPA: alpha-2-macroglobulin, partial [Burkholderiaceae bacterium]